MGKEAFHLFIYIPHDVSATLHGAQTMEHVNHNMPKPLRFSYVVPFYRMRILENKSILSIKVCEPDLAMCKNN